METVAGIEKTASYFTENAENWILDAYENTGHNYPVGFHRVRIVQKIIQELQRVHSVIDVGCGGGQLSCALAEQGLQVLGVDQSEPMIQHAKKIAQTLSPEIAKRLTFQLDSLQDISSGSYDALTAMGFIGYLPEDKVLFETANNLLRDNGYLIVSFRNRLFNLYSISARTKKEAATQEFNELADEAAGLYQKLNFNEMKGFVESLHHITGQILKENLLLQPTNENISPSKAEGKEYSFAIEARQTTPKQAVKIANECGYDTLKLYGVHPHFSLPGLNKLLPFQVYNRLSDSMTTLEENPISLLWSSVFIGVFQKR